MRKQRTLAGAVELAGVGLHTGAPVRLRLLPAEDGTGRVFVRVDQPGAQPIPAHLDHVQSTVRGTNLGVEEGIEVHTVEHVMAALAAARIDNVRIELDGSEPPVADGSSKPFFDLIETVGVVEGTERVTEFALNEPVHFRMGDSELVYLPSDESRFTVNVNFDHPHIGVSSMTATMDEFGSDVAAARTFCLESEVGHLRSMGLIQGGSLENAVVYGAEGPLNAEPLRFHNEPARHKLLDLIGDLSLLPGELRGHFLGIRSGHGSNVGFAKRLAAAHVEESGGVIDVQELMRLLPHRFPFLMIDRVIEHEPGRLRALKNVTANEPHFQGHFPGNPVMPGVLILEGMAQAGSFLLYLTRQEFQDKVLVLATVKSARFRKAVVPGDQVVYEVELLRSLRLSRIRGVARVRGQVVCEADLQAMAVDYESEKGEGA